MLLGDRNEMSIEKSLKDSKKSDFKKTLLASLVNRFRRFVIKMYHRNAGKHNLLKCNFFPVDVRAKMSMHLLPLIHPQCLANIFAVCKHPFLIDKSPSQSHAIKA